jgi:histidinol-phosphate aminotransferase
LLRLPDGRGGSVRAALREAGIAVRRGDTFPGLGPDHVRVAVREATAVEQLTAALAAALARSRERKRGPEHSFPRTGGEAA